MGFSHLHTVVAWGVGFAMSGFLLDAFCPDPATLSPAVREAHRLALETGGPMPEAYANAHYIWYVFAGVGVVAFLCLVVYAWVVHRLDAREGGTPESGPDA